MHTYRSQQSPNLSMPASSAGPAGTRIFPGPPTDDSLDPTRFSINHAEFEIDSCSNDDSTVEAEYSRYVSGKSTGEPDILRFWEVSDLAIPVID